MKTRMSGFFSKKVAYLNPIGSDFSRSEERNRLMLAISDADALGFDSTKDALIEMLRMHDEGGYLSMSTVHF
jgi:hypothetical protein